MDSPLQAGCPDIVWDAGVAAELCGAWMLTVLGEGVTECLPSPHSLHHGGLQ